MRCRLMSGTLTGSNSSSRSPAEAAVAAEAVRMRSHCGPLPSGVLPGAWTGALVLLGAGVTLASLAALAGLLACCVHAVCGKSILGVCGAAQAGAGVLYLVGLALFAGGWGAARVQRLCGPDAAPFYLDSCSLGEYTPPVFELEK